MKTRFLIFILIIITLVEISVLLRSSAESTNKDWGTAPEYLSGGALSVERERWTEIINELGGEKAYAEFKRQYQDKRFGTQHLGAHIVGALLYKKLGIPGLGVCDNSFSFGCYHSFFSEVLVDKGPSVVPMLNDSCLERFGPLGTGCQHGIGHGIMEYFGPRRLLEALEACAPTTAMTPIAGCTSGVFMEYNVPILISAEDATATARPVEGGKPYEPCPSLPDEFQESCYYSIGQWWNQTGEYRNAWKAQGLLCKNIPIPAYMETCYLGVGNIVAPDNDFDPKRAIESCEKMPDKKSIITCRAGASWSFEATPAYKHLAVEMCQDLKDADKKECMRLGNMLEPTNK